MKKTEVLVVDDDAVDDRDVDTLHGLFTKDRTPGGHRRGIRQHEDTAGVDVETMDSSELSPLLHKAIDHAR